MILTILITLVKNTKKVEITKKEAQIKAAKIQAEQFFTRNDVSVMEETSVRQDERNQEVPDQTDAAELTELMPAEKRYSTGIAKALHMSMDTLYDNNSSHMANLMAVSPLHPSPPKSPTPPRSPHQTSQSPPRSSTPHESTHQTSQYLERVDSANSGFVSIPSELSLV